MHWIGNMFTSSDSVSAVPEPATGILLIVATLLLGMPGFVNVMNTIPTDSTSV
jgi:hypothetical protein